MTAKLVGQVSVGQCVPTSATLVAAALADFEAKLAGALAVSASIAITPPTLATSLVAALQLVASLQASLALGLPGIEISLDAILALVAELDASIAALLGLSIALGTAGVYVFTHEGTEQTYGAEMQAQISSIAPPGNNVHSVTFLATDPAVFEALAKVMLVG